MNDAPGRAALLDAMRAALACVDAGRSTHRAFDLAHEGEPLLTGAAARVHVLALGKAAVPMARAAHARLGRAAVRGLVVTKDGHGEGFSAWPLLESAHPVPDARSADAGRRVLAFAAEVPAEDRLLVLLSGGTSALVATPVDGLTLDDLAATNEALLASGAPIEELNAVRKRLAQVSAGRLVAATRAHRVDVWIVSDVVGDDPTSIASGPCHPDPGGFAEACEIVRRRGIRDALPARVREQLEQGAASGRRDAPAPDDPVFARVHTRFVARNRDAVAAAALALERADLAGGGVAISAPAISLLGFGTDGTDGPTDAAGGLVDAGSCGRMRAAGVRPELALERHDALPALEASGDLVRTGPTGTNVMDLTLVWIGPTRG